MDRPKFGTAVPQRRYQVGEYNAVVLGDIESTDDIDYTYILAVIVEGATNPKLYVTLERNRGPRAQEGSHRMRVVGENISEEIGSSDQWKTPDAFAATALAVVINLLALTDEQPVRLM